MEFLLSLLHFLRNIDMFIAIRHGSINQVKLLIAKFLFPILFGRLGIHTVNTSASSLALELFMSYAISFILQQLWYSTIFPKSIVWCPVYLGTS